MPVDFPLHIDGPAGAVMDAPALVQAIVGGGPAEQFSCWPAPPLGHNASADCLGIFNDAQELSLWVSTKLLACTADTLLQDYEMPRQQVKAYMRNLLEIARRSGGGLVAIRSWPRESARYQDNRALAAALDSGALLLISEAPRLHELSPWRGIHVVTPESFRDRIAVARRLQRRLRDAAGQQIK